MFFPCFSHVLWYPPARSMDLSFRISSSWICCRLVKNPSPQSYGESIM
jgi:hypothetical protein